MATVSAFNIMEPPADLKLPLVFDSPHSGTQFPDDFVSPVPQQKLMTAWDAFVEDLWSPAVNNGATLLHANFPRTYIDPNRAPDDIDPADIDGTLPFECKPTVYCERGMALIRKYALPGILMYEKPLTARQVMMRKDHYHTPYHNALSDLLADFRAQYGNVWHIDCHSMKSRGNAMNIDNGKPRPDFVLGDLDGTSAHPEFTDLVENTLRDLGYSVSRNDPYKGGYITQHYGKPNINQHSIQIEINRAVYMNEAEFKPNDNYDNFKKDLTHLSDQIITFIKQQM